MHLIEILLPLNDSDGKRFPRRDFATVRQVLVDRFGGLTAFSRTPAEGYWQDAPRRIETDDILVIEVMADTLDLGWWRGYRQILERTFDQDEIVIRASEMQRL
jgi:hypothetical protein